MTSSLRPIENRTDPKAITVLERRLTALQMRCKGHSFQEIGDALGITRQGASSIIRKALDNLIEATPEETERMRALQSTRLDAMLLAYWDKAMEGNDKAAQTVLKILDHRARLYGLNAPTKLEPVSSLDRPPYESVDAMTDEEVTSRVVALLEGARKRKEAIQKIRQTESELAKLPSSPFPTSESINLPHDTESTED